MAQRTTVTMIPASVTPPLEASTPPRMAAVSPGKTKPNIISGFGEHEEADQRIGLPTAQREERLEDFVDHAAPTRRRRPAARWRSPAIGRTCGSVDGAQRVLAWGELAPPVHHLAHEVLAPSEVGEDVGLALGPGQHPAVATGHPLHGAAAMAANSSAACPGVMRSKQPHSLRMGICWATKARTSAALVERHQHAADGHGLAHGADVAAARRAAPSARWSTCGP